MSWDFLYLYNDQPFTMNREQQLQYCRVCNNQHFDAQHGIICSLTLKPAAFEETCPDFSANTSLQDAAIEKASQQARIAQVGNGKRFGNFIIDYLMVLAVVFTLAVGSTIVSAMIDPASLDNVEAEAERFNYLFYFISHIGYYVILESTFGRTIGKFITKTKVVDEHGRLPTLKAIILRTLARYIPFEAFSFLGGSPGGWHDRLSKTMVVDAN